MHEIYETGFLLQHRDDLLREAEHGRLVRQLKEARQKKTTGLREMILRHLPGGAAGGLRAGDRAHIVSREAMRP